MNEKQMGKLLFQMQMVSLVQTKLDSGEKLSDCIHAISRVSHIDLVSNKMKEVSPRSLYRWFSLYRQEGHKGITEKKRESRPKKQMPKELEEFIRQEISQGVSIPQIIAKAKETGLILPQKPVSRTTLWRKIQSLGIAITRHHRSLDSMRRYSFALRNQMILCDGKHFKAGATHAKRVVIVFLDDATRYALHCVVGESENSRLFLRGLKELVQLYGIPAHIYLDNGSAFVCSDSSQCAGALGTHMIHASVGYPQGKGKIERFNRTLQEHVLRSWPGNIEIDPDCKLLEKRILHWIHEIYNKTPHEGLCGITPEKKWNENTQPALIAADPDKIEEAFIIRHLRRVSNDNIVSIRSQKLEMPCGFARKQVIIEENLLSDLEFYVHDETGRVRLHVLDPVSNATGRTQKKKKEIFVTQATRILKTQADLVYEKHTRPVVEHGGGYVSKHEVKNRKFRKGEKI